MKGKTRFRGTVFYCVAVLLSIVALSGALLSVFHDLLTVTAEEKRDRMLKKLYGANVSVVETVLDGDKAYQGGTAHQAYLMSDNSYAVQTTGNNGYSNGTVTVWTILSCTGRKADNNLVWTGIERVVYESSVNQSYIGRFTQTDYQLFAEHNDKVTEGLLFGSDIEIVKTGASAPSTFHALTNAVNTAITFFRETVLGAKEQETYQYQSYVNLKNSLITVNGTSVEYRLFMKRNAETNSFSIDITVTDGKIAAYTAKKDGTSEDYLQYVDSKLKDGSFFTEQGGMTKERIQELLGESGTVISGDLTAGATRSTEVYLRAAAFALLNYDKILADGGIL